MRKDLNKDSAGEDQRRDIQFIVNNGIIYSKREMLRLLWDLNHIAYYEVIGPKVVNKGRGFVMRVSANASDPTLFLNGRVYININSFNYMKVKSAMKNLTMYELYGNDRIMKIIPDMKKNQFPATNFVAETLSGFGFVEEEDAPFDMFGEGFEDTLGDTEN